MTDHLFSQIHYFEGAKFIVTIFFFQLELLIGNNRSFISELLKVVCFLGKKLDIFSSFRFEIQNASDQKATKIKFRSGRALK